MIKNDNNLNGGQTMRTSKEISAEIRALHTKANAMSDLQNEGGEGYTHQPETKALEAEYYAAKKSESN